MNISHTDFKSSPTNTTSHITGFNPSFKPRFKHEEWCTKTTSPTRPIQHLARLLAQKSYVPIPEDTLEQIMTADDLSAQAKLFHLLVVSLSIINHNITGNRNYALAAKSWAKLLNCSAAMVFKMQKQLQQKGYLKVIQLKDQRGRDQRNLLTPILSVSANANTYFLPLNYDLMNIIISNSDLSSLQKLLWLDLYCMCYKQFLGSQDSSRFDCVSTYEELAQKHNISKSFLSTTLQVLAHMGFVTKRQGYIRHPNPHPQACRNKSVWRIAVVLPKCHLQQLAQTADRTNRFIDEEDIETVALEDRTTLYCDPQYQQMEPLINTSFKIKKDRSTCAGILEDSEVMDTTSFTACSTKDDLSIKNGIGYKQDKKRHDTAATTCTNSSTASSPNTEESTDSTRVSADKLSTSRQSTKPTTETSTSPSIRTNSRTNSISSVPAKSLKDFYPISTEDCAILRHSSGKEFNNEAINEILSSIADKLEYQPHFYSKRGFLAYMSKALQHEIRSPDATNKPGFKILRMPQIVQRFLGTIENICNRYRTTNAIFKQRIASHIAPTKAYRLLKACKEIKPISGILHIYLTNQPAMMTLLTAADMNTITEQAIQTYKDITSVKFEQFALQCAPQETQGRNHFEEPIADEPAEGESRVWHSIKKKFAASYGNVLCNTWLPKLSTKTVTETEVLKYKNHESEVLLLEGGGFIVHWLQENYGNFFDTVAKELGILIVMDGNTRGHIQSYRWNRE